MTRGASSGIRAAEADQETTQYDGDKSFECQQRRPREQLARRKAGEVVNSKGPQSESGLLRDLDVVGSSPFPCHEAAHRGTRHEEKIPKADLSPVVTKMLSIAGQNRRAYRANMSQVAGNTKHTVAENQEGRYEQSDQRTGDVPWPRG